MNEQVTALLESAVWEQVEEMFSKEILDLINPSLIPASLGNAEYAREVRARVLAAERMRAFIKKVKMSGAKKKAIDKPSYK